MAKYAFWKSWLEGLYLPVSLVYSASLLVTLDLFLYIVVNAVDIKHDILTSEVTTGSPSLENLVLWCWGGTRTMSKRLW